VLIVDTGVLVAVGDEADRYYEPCRDLLETDLGPLVTNALVVAETAYMLRRGLGGVAELALLEMIREGTLIAVNLLPEDWDRVAELVERYDDLGLGVTDASVIAMAERLGASRVATLDRAHFRVVRPRHIPAFELLPNVAE
jgi:uncharacterized protein